MRGALAAPIARKPSRSAATVGVRSSRSLAVARANQASKPGGTSATLEGTGEGSRHTFIRIACTVLPENASWPVMHS